MEEKYFKTIILLVLNFCISGCEGTNSHGGGAILVSDSPTMAWERKTCHRKTQCVITTCLSKKFCKTKIIGKS